jgi:hypothetical protein
MSDEGNKMAARDQRKETLQWQPTTVVQRQHCGTLVSLGGRGARRLRQECSVGEKLRK